MGTASSGEWIAILLYFALVIGVGVYFFFRDRNVEGEKEYFLGGRSMGGWVAALSAGASDMSAWVLMGLPGSIYLYGIGKVWIAVGLVIGTICAWVFVAPRLRRYSIRANDSITIPQFLTNRFQSKNGGFSAVCWTDFFQGMLMLAALMLTPILALFVMKGADFVAPVMAVPENYYNALSGGGFNWKSMSDILSGLGWGLGYFGMPHILVRYLSIKSEHEMRKSQIIGCSWIVLILAMSAVVGLIGRQFLGEIDNENLVFVHMVRRLFPAFISGVLLSAILAAAMSTADSQLLASSSAFASDIYKPVIRKDATDHEMQWAGRIIVILISIVAYFIAADPNCGGIMALVECAWAGFGSAFGPVILLSLYWRRLTYSGAIAGVCVGFVVDAVWYAFLSSSTGLYEIIPGFLCGLLAAVIVSLCSKAPSKEVTDLFDHAFEPTD